MIPRDTTEGGWLPLRLISTGGDTQLEWVETASPIADADFEQAASALRVEAAAGRRQLRQTDVAALEAAGTATGPDPAGFIFHVSRCGSTLLTSVLAVLEESSVVAESVIIDDILDGGKARGLPAGIIAARLQGFLRVHARAARPGRAFVKFDCDHLFHFELIRRTFPNVPWIFLYRDPLEVLVSHTRRRGLPMLPSPKEMADWEKADARSAAGALDEYAARKIARICDLAADAHRPGSSLLVNYRDLTTRLYTDILPFLGLTPNATERNSIEMSLQRDAKHPETAFVFDAAEKRFAATAQLRTATERWARPAYERLEGLLPPAL